MKRQDNPGETPALSVLALPWGKGHLSEPLLAYLKKEWWKATGAESPTSPNSKHTEHLCAQVCSAAWSSHFQKEPALGEDSQASLDTET